MAHHGRGRNTYRRHHEPEVTRDGVEEAGHYEAGHYLEAAKGHSECTRQVEPTNGRHVKWWRCYAVTITKLRRRKPIGWGNKHLQGNQARYSK